VLKLKLSEDQDCYLCPIFTVRNPLSGKLVNHKHAGATCPICNRHIHSKNGSICIKCSEEN
jgi:hypothetical protein